MGLEVASGFRRDINGLRAWAVAAVVLFHFGVPGFQAGFLGVDIFFVISGLLMTGLIVKGLTAQDTKFALWDFYLARARRIWPALVAVCAVVWLAGFFTLPSLDYERLGGHIALSLLFLSNMKYRNESGYFDAEAHDKWLLHTWSLSVEWQFYVVFPLVLWGVWKWRPQRSTLLAVLLILGAGSWAWCLWQTIAKPSSAFYSLPARAWELLLGGLLVFVPALTARWARIVEYLGVALIAGALLMLNGASPWPGYWAGLPVLGTALVLAGRHERSWWTGAGWMQWMGSRSYSLYLWHWPLVVALHYAGVQDHTGAVVLGLVLTLLLGELSYRGIEQTARRWLTRMSSCKAWVCLAVAWGAVLAPSVWVNVQKGLPHRLSSASELAVAEAKNGNPRSRECHMSGGDSLPDCVFGGEQIRAVVLGDSHADAVVNAVAAALTSPRDGVLEWTYNACPVLLGVKHVPRGQDASYQCGAFLDHAFKRLQTDYAGVPVIIVNRWSMYAWGPNEVTEEKNKPRVYFTQLHPSTDAPFLEEFAQRLVSTACQLAQDRPVYLVRPIPEMGVHVPRAVSRAFIWHREPDVTVSLTQYHERQDWVWRAQDAAVAQCSGVHVLDPLPYLCRDGLCHGARNGRPLYFDDDHLSEYGNRLLVPMFAKVFADR